MNLFCISCEAPAKTVCSRCYEPYCSLICQIKDWAKHKYTCKPIPELIELSSLLEKTHVSAAKAENPMMKQQSKPGVVEKKAELESTKQPIEKSPIATSKPPTAKRVDVVTEKKSESIPASAIDVPKNTNANIIKAAIDIKPKPVEKKIFVLNDLNTVPLTEGQNVPLLVSDHSLLEKQSIIAVWDFENVAARTKLMSDLNMLAISCEDAENQKKGYKPKEMELCLAIFDEDGQWYRACCFEKLDDKFLVQFIDYGNISFVSPDKIMPINEDLLFPTCVNYCRIMNLPSQDIAKAKELIDKKKVIHANITYDNDGKTYEIEVDFKKLFA